MTSCGWWDRIIMGGVRGDIIGLRITQTSIMEMGQPPAVQSADPAVWIRSRQYTGRVVTVTNARVFDEPVYNYTRDFPYIWEEMSVPIRYDSDREQAESALLTAARQHTILIGSLGKEALDEMRKRYFFKPTEVWPKVYWRLTDDWLELTVRFIVEDHNIRDVKDAITRRVVRRCRHSDRIDHDGNRGSAGNPPALRDARFRRLIPATRGKTCLQTRL